jgi:hypothetical protein
VRRAAYLSTIFAATVAAASALAACGAFVGTDSSSSAGDAGGDAVADGSGGGGGGADGSANAADSGGAPVDASTPIDAGDAGKSAQDAGPLRVFISAETYAYPTPDACQIIAINNTLGGTWVTWISSAGKTPYDQLGAGPWHRFVDGQIAATKADLSSGTGLTAAVQYTEHGQDVVVETMTDEAWTGLAADGTPAANCMDWNASAPAGSMGALGLGKSNTPTWTFDGTVLCGSMARHVYCFEN